MAKAKALFSGVGAIVGLREGYPVGCVVGIGEGGGDGLIVGVRVDATVGFKDG